MTDGWDFPVVAFITVPSTEASRQEPVASSQNKIFIVPWPFRILRRISSAWEIALCSADRHLREFSLEPLRPAEREPSRTFRSLPARQPVPFAIRVWSADNPRPTIFLRDTQTASPAGFRKFGLFDLPGIVWARPDRAAAGPLLESSG